MCNYEKEETVRNMALGAILGAAAVTIGAVCLADNRKATLMMKNAKKTGEKVLHAGEEYVKDIID